MIIILAKNSSRSIYIALTEPLQNKVNINLRFDPTNYQITPTNN